MERDSRHAQVASLQKEKEELQKEEELQAAASVERQCKVDAEGMCTNLATTIQDLKGEASHNEDSMALLTLQVRTMEESVVALTKSSEGLATRLQGTIPQPYRQPWTSSNISFLRGNLISFFVCKSERPTGG